MSNENTTPDLYPEPVVEDDKRVSKEAAMQLMRLSMPPFENFLAHCAALKQECEKAGELTEERGKLFDSYRDALLAARSEYEDCIAQLVREQLDEKTVILLIAFYESATREAVERALALSSIVSNIGTVWQTRVLERCPDTWKMLVHDVGKWQEKNQPRGWKTITPDGPLDDGWRKVDAPMQAEEYVPAAPEEEAELERMRSGDATV